MANFRYINPVDQPIGKFRLIDWLEQNFLCDDFQNFCCLVAFAKINPFYKLHNSIQIWNGKGKSARAVIGIDHKGTSLQALQYVLANFDKVDILHRDHATFHPKLYLFYGPVKASVYYGSSNFTSGGLETNFEGGILINYSLPCDQAEFDDLLNLFNSLSCPTCPCAKTLTPSLLNTLIAKDVLLDETPKATTASRGNTVSSSISSTVSLGTLFGKLPMKPARPIPKNIMLSASGVVPPSTKKAPKKATSQTSKGSSIIFTTKSISKTNNTYNIPVIVRGFVIQVSPHKNGEILLSRRATDQNAAFFNYPFTGKTIPKKSTNPSYPQRVPDPIVNIYVFDSKGTLVNTVLDYPMNTIDYTKKSEIRITITPSILSGLNLTSSNNYPILVMKKSNVLGCDYDLEFYAEGSTEYSNYLAVCNQALPSGGKPIPRKMGWF